MIHSQAVPPYQRMWSPTQKVRLGRYAFIVPVPGVAGAQSCTELQAGVGGFEIPRVELARTGLILPRFSHSPHGGPFSVAVHVDVLEDARWYLNPRAQSQRETGYQLCTHVKSVTSDDGDKFDGPERKNVK